MGICQCLLEDVKPQSHLLSAEVNDLKGLESRERLRQCKIMFNFELIDLSLCELLFGDKKFPPFASKFNADVTF